MHTMQWLTAHSFARVRGVKARRAQEILSAWFAAPSAGTPRVERVPSRRGRPALRVLAADVAALYAVDLEDVQQLAA